MSLKLPVAISAGAVVLLACTNMTQTVDRNYRLFDELAFGGPYDNDLTHGRELVKWNGPIRVVVVGDGAGRFTAEVTRKLDRIAKLTGLSIRHHGAPTSETNYSVEFSAQQGFSIRKDFVPCAVEIGIEDGVINRARIRISTASEAMISTCIAHEMMHSFGFRYHSGIVRSILSPAHGEGDLTRWDELMLTTLYDDRLSPGRPRAESLASVRALIATALGR